MRDALTIIVRSSESEPFQRSRVRMPFGGFLKSLRENRVVVIVADEFKSGDVTVDFMGKPLPRHGVRRPWRYVLAR